MKDIVLGFLNSATPTMDGFSYLHHYIFFHLILIFILISFVVSSFFFYFGFLFQNSKEVKNLEKEDKNNFSVFNSYIIDSDYFLYGIPSFRFNPKMALNLFYKDILDCPFFLMSSYFLTILFFSLLIDLLFLRVYFLFLLPLVIFLFCLFRGFMLLNPVFVTDIGVSLFLVIRIFFITEIDFATLSVFTIVPSSKAPTIPLPEVTSKVPTFFNTPFTRGPVYTQSNLLYHKEPEYYPSCSSKIFREIYLEDRPQSTYLDLFVLKNYNKTQQGATCSNLTALMEKINPMLTNKIPENAHTEDDFHKQHNRVKVNNTYEIIPLLEHDLSFYDNMSLFQKNKEFSLGLSTLLEFYGYYKTEILESLLPSYGSFDLQVKIEGKVWNVDIFSPDNDSRILFNRLDYKTKTKNYEDSMIIINNGDNSTFINLKDIETFIDIFTRFKGKILVASPYNLQFFADLLGENIDISSLKALDSKKDFWITPQNYDSFTCDFTYFKNILYKSIKAHS